MAEIHVSVVRQLVQCGLPQSIQPVGKHALDFQMSGAYTAQVPCSGGLKHAFVNIIVIIIKDWITSERLRSLIYRSTIDSSHNVS